jgi:hypothetical protein
MEDRKMRTNQIILYGLAGIDAQYVPVGYFIMNEGFMTIAGLAHTAKYMMDNYPTIEHIYAIDNRPGLRKEYANAIHDKHNSIESRVVFKHTLMKEGIKIM